MIVPFLNSIPWWAYSIFANLSIMLVEYTNRTSNYEHFGHQFAQMWPFILIAQVGLFYTWRDGPSFMYAWAFFTTGNIMCRVISAHFFVGEKLTFNVAIGIAIILLGGHFVRMGIVK